MLVQILMDVNTLLLYKCVFLHMKLCICQSIMEVQFISLNGALIVL